MYSASNTYIKTRETFTAATHATQTQHAQAGEHKTCNPWINLKMLNACTRSNTLAAAVQFERKAHLNDAVTMQSLTLMIKHVNTDVLQCINQNLAEQNRSVQQYTASTHAMHCACVVSQTRHCRINEERTNTTIAPILQAKLHCARISELMEQNGPKSGHRKRILRSSSGLCRVERVLVLHTQNLLIHFLSGMLPHHKATATKWVQPRRGSAVRTCS
jgi:hypothetical protein